MNENIDLTKILKDCPKGTKLYSIAYGDVKFEEIAESKEYPIYIRIDDYHTGSLTADGKIYANSNGECALFPSKEQRDWSKFTAPWLKKERFDPKTLKPFDKVLTRRGSESYNAWFPDFISDPPNDIDDGVLCMCNKDDVTMVIPYNEDTKHLICTNKEAPEYYRYWED